MTNAFTPPAPLQTAVLLLVFNRPDTTAEVFEAIRKAEPPRLYIASDGPRGDRPGEADKVNKVREIATAVDWPCEVKTLFRKKNLGCGTAVKGALDWYFDQEETGVILEDDTVPALSFFWFCESLLTHFKLDDRVGLIAGTNHIGYRPRDGASYIFSNNRNCWGWASWRRSWHSMDFQMKWRNSELASSVMEQMGRTSWAHRHWRNALKKIDSGEVDTWDWQWFFSKACQNQLSIYPSKNLVKNIGFGPDATHTKSSTKKKNFINIDSDIRLPLTHPAVVVADCSFDSRLETFRFKPKYPRILSSFIANLRSKMKWLKNL